MKKKKKILIFALVPVVLLAGGAALGRNLLVNRSVTFVPIATKTTDNQAGGADTQDTDIVFDEKPSEAEKSGDSTKKKDQTKKAAETNTTADTTKKEQGTAAQNPPGSNPSNPTAPSNPTVPGGSCISGAWTPGSADPWGDCWPGPDNTGVPAGVSLTQYTGPCTITTANTVIDAKSVNCVLSIRAENVTITRSRVVGGVDVPSAAPSNASFTIRDSSVHIADNLGTGLMRRNFTANRVNITGGRRSVYCVINCTVENSWVHAQGGDPDGEAHFSGMRMEQNTTYRHNSITCEATRVPGSGCSAGLTGYPDFAPVRGNLIERNLFYRGGGGGSTVCAYGGATPGKAYSSDPANATNIRFIGNRFVLSETGHCGNIRTIINFDPSRSGNVWQDNLFHNGAAVTATGP